MILAARLRRSLQAVDAILAGVGMRSAAYNAADGSV
jgi:hypothetical protein